MNFTNKQRAERLGKVLATYETDDTDLGGLIDLLTDARHWCDSKDESYGERDRIAYQHYLAELAEEREYAA